MNHFNYINYSKSLRSSIVLQETKTHSYIFIPLFHQGAFRSAKPGAKHCIFTQKEVPKSDITGIYPWIERACDWSSQDPRTCFGKVNELSGDGEELQPLFYRIIQIWLFVCLSSQNVLCICEKHKPYETTHKVEQVTREKYYFPLSKF